MSKISLKNKLYGNIIVFRKQEIMNNAAKYLFSPFHATDLFLYPLKTPENPGFVIFSGVIERDQWNEMG